jgi:D-alanyl-D-alanine carboxypeptidase/D-alanyl-D-alanine-endopeptidase (penicillin-binding protein 4)
MLFLIGLGIFSTKLIGRSQEWWSGSASKAAKVLAENPPVAKIRPTLPAAEDFLDRLQRHGQARENQGILLQTLDGKVLIDHNSDKPFNPASVMKLITSYLTLKHFGPDYQFKTTVYTTGTIDATTQTLAGDLIIEAEGDPNLRLLDVRLIGQQLREQGIRRVTGQLLVHGPLRLRHYNSLESSYYRIRAALGLSFAPLPRLTTDSLPEADKVKNFNSNEFSSNEKGNRPIDSDWEDKVENKIEDKVNDQFVNESAEAETATTNTIVANTLPAALVAPVIAADKRQVLATHLAQPLKDLLLYMNAHSDNFYAEELGDSVGGPLLARQELLQEFKLDPQNFDISHLSGLEYNRVTGQDLLKIFQAMIKVLAHHQLSLADIAPVAGIDAGTLAGRLRREATFGAVVAKTGTLYTTDNGVSTLAGIMHTAEHGPILFAIFNTVGQVNYFRREQDRFINDLFASLPLSPVAVRTRDIVLHGRDAVNQLDGEISNKLASNDLRIRKPRPRARLVRQNRRAGAPNFHQQRAIRRSRRR